MSVNKIGAFGLVQNPDVCVVNKKHVMSRSSGSHNVNSRCWVQAYVWRKIESASPPPHTPGPERPTKIGWIDSPKNLADMTQAETTGQNNPGPGFHQNRPKRFVPQNLAETTWILAVLGPSFAEIRLYQDTLLFIERIKWIGDRLRHIVTAVDYC